MKTLIVLTIALMMTACSSVGTKNVQQVEVKSSVVYTESFSKVWEDAIEWFAINNIPIDKMDKESGLLTSEYGLGANQDIINCGEPTGNIGLYTAKFDGTYANINVLIRQRDSGTRATINVFGNAHVSLRNGYGLVGESNTKCYSTGRLENRFHEFISGNG
jgi:hypothetical protein